MTLTGYLKVGAALALLAGLAWTHSAAFDAGRQAERAAVAAITKRKLDDASLADTAHNRCVADPACRLSDDGFRRD